MVGSQDQGFCFFIVSVAAGGLASVPFAVLALEAQFAILSVTVTIEIGAAAVAAVQGLGKHRLFLPIQTQLSHYQLFHGLSIKGCSGFVADTILSTDAKKQLPELLARLADGVQRQIIQSEKDLEGFTRIQSDMERELSTLRGAKQNPTLLELLGYSYGDVEDHPRKMIVVGQITYSPDYVLKHDGQTPAVLDLKAPGINLDHPTWVGQVKSYCRELKAPLGILFNGQSIRVYINTDIKTLEKYRDLFLSEPVAAAEYHDDKGVKTFVELLMRLSTAILAASPVAVARKLASERKKELEDQKRQKAIRERVAMLLLQPPTELLCALSVLDSVWEGVEPKPSETEVLNAWSVKKTAPLTVDAVEATAKQSINSIVRQKVALICARACYEL